MGWRMGIGGWIERMMIVSVMSGGIEGEEACENDVGEGEVGGLRMCVRVRRVKTRMGSGVTLAWFW